MRKRKYRNDGRRRNPIRNLVEILITLILITFMGTTSLLEECHPYKS
jgi:hypothetical protein